MKPIELSAGRQFTIVLATVFFLLSPLFAEAREYSYETKSSSANRQRTPSASAVPIIMHAAHSRGNIQLALANNGTFGTFGETIADPFTGEPIPSCEYPRNSDIVYLWVGGFWIGAIVDRDTLVSCGSEDFYNTREFWPDLPELGGEFKFGSIDEGSKFFNPSVKAYSEEDFICEYFDTTTNPTQVGRDPRDNRPHIPLGLKVTQRTMAWSYDYADDFILFDNAIENVGKERLREVYMGIWVDGDAFHVTRRAPTWWTDDIVGFYPTHPAPEGCGFIDTVAIAYHADNDGDPEGGAWDFKSPLSVLGTRVVRTPSDSLQYSFNWWIIDYGAPQRDFGPRRQGTPTDPFRDFGARLGTPSGDLNRYYVLSHPEFDYDLITTAINKTEEGWLPPPGEAADFAQGSDCRYLLSFGPFAIEPGQTLPITFAWVGGENFHQGPNDYVDHWDPYDPDKYYDRLNFNSLASNSRWASWVYDNPGVDTDNDGYRGKSRICYANSSDSSQADTFWYEGDGVPDFRGAGPPPAPRMSVTPSIGKLTVRWNGYFSENTKDVFTNRLDFEGYRVYSALDDRPSSFTLIHSYDRENYSRFTWTATEDGGVWIQDDVPFTREVLQVIYADSTFEPMDYTQSDPLFFDNQYYYFVLQDYNQSGLLDPRGIRKAFPEAEDPGPDSTLWTEADLTYEHGLALPKYYEYELIFDNILPTVPYYMAVTAFDYGSPSSGLASLETKPLNNHVIEYPQNPVDSIEQKNLDVFIYPNPYRLDANYASRGYENRDRSRPADYARRVHFSNLPRVCKISIYSIDGDLIREWTHDYPEGGPGSMHNSWDLITRNAQTVVSGIYYWVVESDTRTQIGKVVIIK